MPRSRDESDFSPIAPNPFIVGNPIRDPSMFFGRQEEFEIVRSRFQESDHGGLLIFCGERRSGKTSILYQILQGRLGPAFIPVLIDMQSMAIQDEADFLQKIAREIGQRLDPEGTKIEIPDFAASRDAAAAFHEFVDRVLRRDPDRKPILLFDEYELLETKIDAGILRPDVLHILSHLMEHYSVFMVFTGSEHLEQRRRDYWRFLGRALHKRISYLSRRDATSLITSPVEGQVDYDDRVLERILRLTAGQPFYTQGICQVLVDTLNEKKTNHATIEILDEVVEHLVENPFPQMLFLWDGLQREEKLALGLLAEALESPDDFATPEDLERLAQRRGYPLPMKRADLATTLEGLFKHEFLLRDDRTPAGFAFRMDLWRLWTKRMHSVWQVVRELDLPRTVRRAVRVGPLSLDRRLAIALLAGLVLVPALGIGGPRLQRMIFGTDPAPVPQPAPDPAEVVVRLRARPVGVEIHRDGELVAREEHTLRLREGESQRLLLRSAGYADSTLSVIHGDSAGCAPPPAACVALAAGDTTLRVELRPRRGSVRIRTQPPGASITVDGAPRGTGEALLEGLLVPREHELVVEAPGHVPRSLTFRVEAETLRTLPTVVLERRVSAVSIVTTPGGALVQVDDEPAKTAPDVWQLTHGDHRVRIESQGHVERDTTITVDGATTVRIALEPLADGAIWIRGERLADIWIEGERVCREGRSSLVRPYPPGTYPYRIYLSGQDEPIEGTLEVRAGELVELDYTTGGLTRGPWTEEG